MEDALVKGLSDVVNSGSLPPPREPTLRPLPTTPAELPRAATATQLRTVPTVSTLQELSDKLLQVENINRALKEKVQSEKMALTQEHDRKWSECNHHYDRALHDLQIKIENEREDALRKLKTDYQLKAQEIDRIASRIIDQTDH